MNLTVERCEDLQRFLDVDDKIKVLDQKVHYCSNKNGIIKKVSVDSNQMYRVTRKSGPDRKNVIIEYAPVQAAEDFGFKGFEWINAVIYPDNFKNIVIVRDEFL